MTTAEEDIRFAQAKAYLMRADDTGISIYDHLHELVASVMDENPNDVLHHPERFAQLSSQAKRHLFVYGDKTPATNKPPALHHTAVTRANQNKKLFDKPLPEVTTKIEKPTPFTTVTTTTVVPKRAPPFRSLVAENLMWRYASCGLPDAECFLLDQAITKLAAEKKLDEVRFFGKIFGSGGNYIVVTSRRYVAEQENVYEEVNEMPKPPRKKVEVDIQAEPAYKGCNRLSFWVTPHAAAEWTLLPDVTPQQVNAARSIKKFFTGNLDAPVVSYPAFPGTERNYLRAQLSRIFSATYIAPVNAMDKVEPEEDEDANDDDDEGKPKGPKPAKYWPLVRDNKEYVPDEEAGVAALNDLEQWQHAEGYIYETGRQTKVPPKPETDEEEAEAQEEDDEAEEQEEKKEEEEKELLTAVKADKSYAIIHLPKEPNPEGEEDDEPEPEPEGEGEGDEEKSEKEEEDEDIADDDPLRKKISPWVTRVTNTVFKRHAVLVLKSLRWPGAVAYSAQGGKAWGCVYFGAGFKQTDHAFAPVPAPPILKECDEMVEVMDPTAANEKLVMRGEEPKEADSEDEKEEDDENDGDM